MMRKQNLQREVLLAPAWDGFSTARCEERQDATYVLARKRMPELKLLMAYAFHAGA